MKEIKVRKEMTGRTVLLFFAMAFGLSWGLAGMLFAFPDVMIGLFGPVGYTNPLFILAVYAPGLSGIALVLRHYGVRGFGSYLKRLTIVRMPLGWFTYLLIGIPLAYYIAATIKGDTVFASPFTPWYSAIPALLTGLMIGPMEEFGWRGVALPLLQRRFRPIAADLILSTLWAIWHVPAFFMSGTPQSQWSFPAFFVGVVSVSFILTPLFNAARGSILIAALYHFQINNPIWPDAQPYDSLVFGIVAVLAVVINRRALFTKGAGVTEIVHPDDVDRLVAPQASTLEPSAGTLAPQARPATAPDTHA